MVQSSIHLAVVAVACIIASTAAAPVGSADVEGLIAREPALPAALANKVPTNSIGHGPVVRKPSKREPVTKLQNTPAFNLKLGHGPVVNTPASMAKMSKVAAKRDPSPEPEPILHPNPLLQANKVPVSPKMTTRLPAVIKREPLTTSQISKISTAPRLRSRAGAYLGKGPVQSTVGHKVSVPGVRVGLKVEGGIMGKREPVTASQISKLANAPRPKPVGQKVAMPIGLKVEGGIGGIKREYEPLEDLE